MQVTLIGTRHREVGNCKSKELYHILETINPEVIFEEMPPKNFDEYYISKCRSRLESIAIEHFVNNYGANVIPIDLDDIPEKEFVGAYHNIHKKVDGLANQYGFDYRSLTNMVRSQTVKYGFKYLNSMDYANAYMQMNEIIENALKEIKDSALLEALSFWNRINNERENHMLQNIYSFCEDNRFAKAVFIVGAAHRRSIINKISSFEKNVEVELSWKF